MYSNLQTRKTLLTETEANMAVIPKEGQDLDSEIAIIEEWLVK